MFPAILAGEKRQIMKIPIRAAAGVFASLAFGSLASAKDLTITSKVSNDRNPNGTAVSYLASDHVRIAEPDGNEFIVDFKSGQMTTLNGQRKTYYVTTKQDIEKMTAAMQARMNSPEMKKATEQMGGAMSGMADSFEVKKTGATRRIAGYPCEVWVMNVAQISRTESCLSTELQFPLQTWEMYRGFADSMRSMMASFGPMAKDAQKMQEKFKNMKGYPLATSTSITMMGHSTTTASEVIDVKTGPIPPSAWEVPAGYTKVNNPMARAFSKSR